METIMTEDSHNSEQEPEEEIKTQEPSQKTTDEQSSLPLFLRNSLEGNQGNAQDEKDSSGE
jgi:hypothetical protein